MGWITKYRTTKVLALVAFAMAELLGFYMVHLGESRAAISCLGVASLAALAWVLLRVVEK